MGNAALIVCDMQNDIAGFYGRGEQLDRLVASIKDLTVWARGQGITVIYCCVGYRPGYIDVIPQLAGPIKQHGLLGEGTPGVAVMDELAPQDGDVIMLRRRTSGFYGTDLELLLRAMGADTVILAGMSTARVVESTARDGSDRDLRVIVASDCCAADKPELHDAALLSIGDWFGRVLTAEEIKKEFAS